MSEAAIRWAGVGLLALCVCLGPWPCRAEETIPLDALPGPDVREIEIVFVEGKKPSVTFRATPTPAEEAKVETLVGATADLLPRLGDPVALEECDAEAARSAKVFRLAPKAGARSACRWLIPFGGKEGLVDILSFGSLALKGTSVGPFSIALAERTDGRLGVEKEVAKWSGKLDVAVPLAPVAAVVDLRRIAGLIVSAGQGGKSLTLERVRLTALPHDPPPDVRTGLWVWEYKEAVAQAERVVDTCLSLHCTRMAVQIPDLSEDAEVWKAYAQLLRSAQRRGIESLALDGYPEAVLHSEPLVQRIEKALALPGNPVVGVQLDIEPYLLPQFAAHPEEGDRRYVDLISRMAALIGEKSSLSVVMPFWFVHRRVDGYPIGFAMLNLADDVAVMSYRTDRSELLAVSNDWIRYSRLTGIPVWLSLETRALPREEHLVLVPEPDAKAVHGFLDIQSSSLILRAPSGESGYGYRIKQRYSVLSERLSFAGTSRKNVKDFISGLISDPAASALSGLMIHDWTGYQRLPD